MELTMQIVSGLQNLIKRYKIDKDEFCKLFSIKPSQYNNYIKGNWNYAIDDMATLNYTYQKLEKQKIDEEDLIKIASEKTEYDNEN
jgi:predicted transcriptional regulator